VYVSVTGYDSGHPGRAAIEIEMSGDQASRHAPTPATSEPARRERLVLEMTEAIGAATDTMATAAAAAAVLREAIGADRVTIALCDLEREVVTDVITTDLEPGPELAALRGASLARLPLWPAIADRGLLVAPDARGLIDPTSPSPLGGLLAFVLRHPAAESEAERLPLAVALCSWNVPQKTFDPDALRLVQNLGAQAALTLAAAYHRARAADLSERLSNLVTWAGQLSSAERPGTVVSLAARAGSELLAAPRVGVWSIAGVAHHPSSPEAGPRLDAAVASVPSGPSRCAVLAAAAAPPALASALGELALDWMIVAQSGDGSCRLVAGCVARPGPVEEQIARLLVDLTGESIRRAQAYEEMAHLAVTDALTGLGNRGAFEARMPEAVAHSLRYARPFAFCVLDIDDFRQLNERGGHPLGDESLRAVAASIRAQARGSDLAYRIGGDEFALILPETTKEEAVALLERILAGARRLGPEPVSLTAGVAQCPDDGTSAETVYRRADEALYRGKRDSRGRVTVARAHQPGAEGDVAPSSL
jgi:diguanylate cyclase (GGDEF)-like protein